MSQIEEVSRLIAENLNGYKVIVEKSTGPGQDVASGSSGRSRLYKKTDQEFDVASNPEFLREGSAVSDFLNPDRIIIGVESDRARDMLVKIYDTVQDRILITNIDTAELIKHASNSFLALKISYINLMANLCEKTDADIEQVARGMGLDPRIGGRFLKAGLGLRRLVLSEGPQGPDQDRRGPRRGHEPPQGDRPDQHRPGHGSSWTSSKKALWILKDKKIADPRACRSSPRRTTSARRRASG